MEQKLGILLTTVALGIALEMGKAIEEGAQLNALRCVPDTMAEKDNYEACLESEGANDPEGSFEDRKLALEHCGATRCKVQPPAETDRDSQPPTI